MSRLYYQENGSLMTRLVKRLLNIHRPLVTVKEQREPSLARSSTVESQATGTEQPLPLKKKKSFPNFSWAVKNYLPHQLIAEDESAVHKHIQVMHAEHKKTTKDSQRINDLLGKTFPYRRQFIIKENPKIMDMKTMFPLLFEEYQECILSRRVFITLPSSYLQIFAFK